MATLATALAIDPPRIGRRPRVLFVGEAVTLAHVARPFALASAGDPDRFDVVFASDPRSWRLLGEPWFELRRIDSVAPERFLGALAAGRAVYDLATLRRYLDEDQRLLDEVRPDLVVSDFRLTMPAAAEVAGVPSATIVNAYWTPAAGADFPLPELRLARVLGRRITRALFRLGLPAAMALHAMPMERLRRAMGLESLRFDLRRVYTAADHVLLADPAELVPIEPLPANHHYLGPIEWSAPAPVPDGWHSIPASRPAIYVNLGSSGDPAAWPAVQEGLAGGDWTVLAATAGRRPPSRAPSNFLVADYLPGRLAAERCSLAICNGGAPAAHQALVAGAPVLGVVSNMDQFLNMQGIERAGVGRTLRAGEATPARVRERARRMLADPELAARTRQLSKRLRQYDAPAAFWRFAEERLDTPARKEVAT